MKFRILNQSGNCLTSCVKIYLSGKQIIGHEDYSGAGGLVLGKYATNQEAQSVLQSIVTVFETNPKAVYRMP